MEHFSEDTFVNAHTNLNFIWHQPSSYRVEWKIGACIYCACGELRIGDGEFGRWLVSGDGSYRWQVLQVTGLAGDGSSGWRVTQATDLVFPFLSFSSVLWFLFEGDRSPAYMSRWFGLKVSPGLSGGIQESLFWSRIPVVLPGNVPPCPASGSRWLGLHRPFVWPFAIAIDCNGITTSGGW